jgi:PAS domain S-box-containing protein
VHSPGSGTRPGCPAPQPTKIFLVEDELVFAEDLRETLESRGYAVCGSVPTGEEALVAIPRESPDLVLIDIVLAGRMNGIELADAIRSLIDIPVIFLTSNIEDDTIANAKCTKPYGYIPKPFDERVLFSTIEIALFKHQADRQIRESENRYRTFVENIQGIAYRYDRNHVLEFFHGAIEKISGYPPADFIEGIRVWSEIIHTDDREGAMFPDKDDDPAFLKNRSREYRIVRKDNEIRWIHDQTRITYRSGFPEPLFEGMIYDITPLKAIEADLRKACDIRTVILLMSSHFFRRFLKKDASGTPADEEHRLLSSLSEILGAVGYEMDVPVISLYQRTVNTEGIPLISEILRCVHPKHIPPADIRTVRDFPYTQEGFARWDDQLLKGYPVSGTISQLPPSEQGFFQDPAVTSVAMVPLFSEDGFRGFIQAACFHDAHAWTDYEISSMQIAADVIATIIESRLASGMIFSSPGRVLPVAELTDQPPAMLMDAAVDIVFIADPDGKILHMNRAGLDLFAIGQDTGDTGSSYGKFTDCIRENIGKLRSSPQVPGEGSFDLELDTGEKRVFLGLTLSPVYDSRDRTLFMGIARDITRQKILQQNQREIQKKLLLMQKIFRHDLNNQITAILGYLSLSKKETNNPAFLGFIEKEERIVDSIRKSMGFTKIYENLGDESATWIDIAEIFSSAWASLAQTTVRLDLPDNSLEILVDPLFRNVVFNLLDNSLRHGGKNLSVIRVSLSCGDDVVLLYEDNGAGILTENKEKIFNRGFYTNNGFGLLLIREILSLTGLSIRETGTPGRGACFEIMVPRGMWRSKEQKR